MALALACCVATSTQAADMATMASTPPPAAVPVVRAPRPAAAPMAAAPAPALTALQGVGAEPPPMAMPAPSGKRLRGLVHLEARDVDNRTWAYPHINFERFGTVELAFGPGNRVEAHNNLTRSGGYYQVANDRLCAMLQEPNWGTICYYMVRDEEGLAVVFESSGRRAELTVR